MTANRSAPVDNEAAKQWLWENGHDLSTTICLVRYYFHRIDTLFLSDTFTPDLAATEAMIHSNGRDIAMNSTYNIYRQLSDARIVWVDRMNGLDQATERARGLRAAVPGDYLIYDVRERTVVQALQA